MSKEMQGIADPLPWSNDITAYDQANLITYLRLLDAKAAGASDAEICRHILDLDVDVDPDRALRILRDHMKRAEWMTAQGYRHLHHSGQGSSQKR
jgi:hypothetical protein